MTEDEGRIVAVLAGAARNRGGAAMRLRELAGDGAISPPLSVAAALGNALGDLGHPLALDFKT